MEMQEKLCEDDGFVGVGEDAVAEVPADSAGEDEAFEVASLLDEVGELVALGDADERQERHRSRCLCHHSRQTHRCRARLYKEDPEDAATRD